MWLRRVKAPQVLEAFGKLSKSQWLLQTNTFSDISFKKSKLAPLQERKMIDRCRVRANGGEGGNGCTSFRRSRHDRRGRADGGSGGRGGDVILECSPTIWDLSSVQHHINAKRGGHGGSKNMIGTRGADKVVLVPVGTVIHLVEGEIPSTVETDPSAPLDPWDIPGQLDSHPSDSTQQTKNCTRIDESPDLKQHAPAPAPSVMPSRQSSFKSSVVHMKDLNSIKSTTEQVDLDINDDDMPLSDWEEDEEEEEIEDIQYNVAELTEPGQRLLVAQGGVGGLGNICTHKPFKNTQKDESDLEESDDDQRLSLSTGLPGSKAILLLELKSIADVGLVGMPNAGKSTLLGAISRARPTVGHYAFTTLRPNLGNLNYDDFSVKVADIPGIIRGAHENRGLGHAFLRHIERTKVLAYVVDLAAGLEGNKGIPPWEQLRDLISELEFYQEGLSDRPSLVVANKIDEAGTEDVLEELNRRVSGVPVFPVCAILEEGVAELKAGLRKLVSEGGSERLVLEGMEI